MADEDRANVGPVPGNNDACVGCGEKSPFVCPFCMAYARELCYVCGRPECREKHEQSERGCIRTHSGKWDPAKEEVGGAREIGVEADVKFKRMPPSEAV